MTIGVDIGTTSVKALAVDGAGQVLARARARHAVVVPSALRLEHDAESAWRQGPRRAITQVVEQLRARSACGGAPLGPRAVAVAAMVPTIAAVDDEGRPVSPGVLYGDERGWAPGVSGQADPTRSTETLGLIEWAAAAFPGARGYWPAQAVANRSLGGAPAVDLGTAMSAGPLFGSAGWDEARCAEIGVDSSQLPAAVLFGEAIGEAGSPVPGATLVAGGVDAFCEQLVAGPLGAGDVLVVCGSTLVVWMVDDARGSSGTGGTTPGPGSDGLWRLPALVPGQSLVGGPSNAGGLFLDWVDSLLRPSGDEGPAPDLDPGAVPIWHPYVRGERVPFHDPALRASVGGLDLTQGPPALRRAAYEGSAMVVRDIVERAGGQPSRIVVAGGGIQVPGWLQAIADVTAVAVEPVAVPEGAALGAAWLARVGCGLEPSIEGSARWAGGGPVVEPRPAWVAACAERYNRYREGAPAQRSSG